MPDNTKVFGVCNRLSLPVIDVSVSNTCSFICTVHTIIYHFLSDNSHSMFTKQIFNLNSQSKAMRIVYKAISQRETFFRSCSFFGLRKVVSMLKHLFDENTKVFK
jgi:hypothetical protein